MRLHLIIIIIIIIIIIMCFLTDLGRKIAAASNEYREVV